MPEKNIPDSVQSILDKNKGFMKVKDLPPLLSLDIKRQLGLKRNSSASLVMKKLEGILEDRFIFRKKGSILYILTPSMPDDIVLSVLTEKPTSPKILARSLPFTTTDFMEIVNDLVNSGRAKIILNDKLEARIVSSAVRTSAKQPEPLQSGEYTQEKFREAFIELDNGRIFVRICDLRKRLGWPEEIFDETIRDLRNRGVIGVYLADESTMTEEEINACFVDENNYRMGTVTWNAR